MKKYDHIRIYAIGGEMTADKKAQIIANFRKNHASELTGMENDDAIWNMFMSQPIDNSEPEEETLEAVNSKTDKLFQDNPGLKDKVQEYKNRGAIKDPVVTQNTTNTEAGKSSVNGFGVISALNDTSSPTAADAARDIMKAATSGGNPMAAISSTFGAALGVADKALMGDKKFNEQSQAMDDAANGLANVASQFGPWGQAAAMAIRAANFADKAAGQTVPGYDVNIESSGFTGVNAHGDTASLRLTQSRNVDKMLGRQQQQVQMALAAAQLDKDNSLQQEARGASVQDIINRNQIALAGGLGTTTLGA